MYPVLYRNMWNFDDLNILHFIYPLHQLNLFQINKVKVNMRNLGGGGGSTKSLLKTAGKLFIAGEVAAFLGKPSK